MKHLKNQAILLSIVFGLIPIIELCYRLLGNGEKVSNEYHLIIGIISLILVSFPIGIFITLIRNNINEQLKDYKKLFRFFIASIILNTVSIPILGLNSTITTLPSIIFGWIVILLFMFQINKSKETRVNILDEKTF